MEVPISEGRQVPRLKGLKGSSASKNFNSTTIPYNFTTTTFHDLISIANHSQVPMERRYEVSGFFIACKSVVLSILLYLWRQVIRLGSESGGAVLARGYPPKSSSLPTLPTSHHDIHL